MRESNNEKAQEMQPLIIKKSATRRLYNTQTSAHITLDDVAAMAKNGTDFVVQDAKTGEDITRHILTQVIFEGEEKLGQNLLPITFMRQLERIPVMSKHSLHA